MRSCIGLWVEPAIMDLDEESRYIIMILINYNLETTAQIFGLIYLPLVIPYAQYIVHNV